MTESQLFSLISSLPDEMKKEIEHFAEFLKQKIDEPKPITERKFGYAKGFFKMLPSPSRM